MNASQVFRTISILLLLVSAFMLLPIGVAVFYHEFHLIVDFVIPIVIASACALTIFWRTRRQPARNLSIQDGFLFVSLSWILAAFVGSLPFYLSHTIPSFTDAYFETMSGFSTTGASILSDIESLPRCMLFWRSLTHWLGGMGIVVLTVALLPLLGVGGVYLLKAEAPGPSVDKTMPRIAQTAKTLWLVYLGLTLAEIILLKLGGMDLFDASTHTFGTLATGGFSPKNSSVGHFTSPYLQWVITVFMILAGINFGLYFRVLTGKFRQVFLNTELRIYLLIFLVSTGLIAISLSGGEPGGWSTSLRLSAFQTASILTTTGYATADFEIWPAFSRVILFVLMFIGGCSGSTGGGIKVIRIIALFKLGWHEMQYMIHPRGIFQLKLDNSGLRKNFVYTVSGFFFLYFFLLMLITVVVSTAGNGILTAFTTALATLGNIGPGFGKIGPTENYAFFPAYVKWVLSFAMMTGRLEIYTVLVLFTRGFWK